MLTTAASLLPGTRKMTMMGPKTSSFAMRISCVASAITVGAKKRPVASSSAVAGTWEGGAGAGVTAEREEEEEVEVGAGVEGIALPPSFLAIEAFEEEEEKLKSPVNKDEKEEEPL